MHTLLGSHDSVRMVPDLERTSIADVRLNCPAAVTLHRLLSA